jgi:cysteine desulfurase
MHRWPLEWPRTAKIEMKSPANCFILHYFDHNSTTPVDPDVAATVAQALGQTFGNPSSTHRAGQQARQELEKARRTVAQFLGASAAEIVFTSGGTEANNLAIFGVVRAAAGRARHVISTTVEHPAVLEPCRQLEREGVSVSYAPVNAEGVVSIAEIERFIRPETVLISVMHANNETGAIQPVAEIAELVKQRRVAGQQIFLHSDGVQAAGKIPLRVSDVGVDLYSVSSHKLYAPKGCGVLFVRKNTPLESLQFGGRHERGRRAGTENVVGAMGMARAMELCVESGNVRDLFERSLRASIADVKINSANAERLPNTSNVLFRGVSAEALVIALDMRGMAASTGSACSSGSVEPSHVLLAMGLSEEQAKSSVRFSFGRGNSAEDGKALVDALMHVVAKMRKHAVLETSSV